MKSVGYQRL